MTLLTKSPRVAALSSAELFVPGIAAGDALGHLTSSNTLTRTPTILVQNCGALAQMGERLICIQEVRSSILLGSTITRFDRQAQLSVLPSNRTN